MHFYNKLFFSLKIELSTSYPSDSKYFSINSAVVLVLPSPKECICHILLEKLAILLIASTIFISSYFLFFSNNIVLIHVQLHK